MPGTNLDYPGDISVDSSNMYFTEINIYEGGTTDGLFSCPKSGCPVDGGSPAVLVTGLSFSPSETFVQGTSLYFGQDTIGVSVCTLPGCTSPTTVQGPSGVHGIALDATKIYWSDPSAGVIYSCPAAGCGGNAPTVVGSGLAYPNAIALDSSYVYIAVGSQSDAGLSRGIYRLPK
jgi:hypothetical protein